MSVTMSRFTAATFLNSAVASTLRMRSDATEALDGKSRSARIELAISS